MSDSLDTGVAGEYSKLLVASVSDLPFQNHSAPKTGLLVVAVM